MHSQNQKGMKEKQKKGVEIDLIQAKVLDVSVMKEESISVRINQGIAQDHGLLIGTTGVEEVLDTLIEIKKDEGLDHLIENEEGIGLDHQKEKEGEKGLDHLTVREESIGQEADNINTFDIKFLIFTI